MKKILFMVSSMNIGGVEKSLLSLLSFLKSKELEITVLTLVKKGGFLKYVPSWVKVEKVDWFEDIQPIIMQPPQNTIKEFFHNKRYVSVITYTITYLLSKYLKDRYIYYKYVFKNIPYCLKTYDIAVAYQGPTDIIDYYLAYKVKAKKKVSWVHFDVSQFPINIKLYKKLYKSFNQVYAVSEVVKGNLINAIPLLKSKVDIFYNSISYNLISDMSRQPLEFEYNTNDLIIVTVGRLSEEKGQDLAIKALAKLLEEGYRVKWYCVGDGVAKEQYKALITEYKLENNFFLVGAKINPYSYMAKADIYVQTSRHEGYCQTLAEAKYLNKPIVSTNFTAAAEQIIDGYNGILAKCNEKDLHEKIKDLLDKPEKREMLTNNLRNAVMCKTIDLTKLNSFLS